MRPEIFAYIAVMALVTYLIRLLPLTLIRRRITNRYIRSFLYYVPYATLSAMTFPAILSSTGSTFSAALGFAAALFLAFRGKSLLSVAVFASAVVLVCELLFPLLPL
ncbi:MAG: AzlD domain-containing protein [Acutalibacteraceae bacterium]